MHNETLIQNVLQVLQALESAPGAYNLVRAHSDNPPSAQELEDAYEQGEGENDQQTEAALRALTPEQLESLIGDLAEIDEENFTNYGADYPEASGGLDIRSMLGLPSR